jgi:hypothetical protein
MEAQVVVCFHDPCRVEPKKLARKVRCVCMKRTLKSKTVPREPKPRAPLSTRKRGVIIVIVLLLSLLAASSGLMAQRGSLWPAARPTVAAQNEPTSLTTPSKEYIYAGSRLVATEEPCLLSLSSTCAFYSLAGGQGSATIMTGAGCAWSVANPNTWITLTSATNGSGNEPLAYEVRENFTASPRQGTITVGGQTLTITQDSSALVDCVYVINPISAAFSNAANSGNFQIFCEERCAWQAVSNMTWVTVTGTCAGIGTATVTYSVAANPTGAGRNATITIGGKTFNVKQKA